MDNGSAAIELGDFHDVIIRGLARSVEARLASGMSAEANQHGYSPLFRAAAHNHPDIIDLLIGAGAQLEKPVIESKSFGTVQNLAGTALHGAARNLSLDSLERLLAHGADVLALDGQHRTAAHRFLMSPRLNDMAADEVVQACRVLAAMFDRGLDPNKADNLGETLVHSAVLRGAAPAILNLLLDRGADPHIIGLSGSSAFHVSCMASRVEQFNVFVARGVDVNSSNYRMDGRYPLHFCNTEESFDAIMVLRPDLEVRDREGRTPLASVLYDPETELTAYKAMRLLVAGANPDNRDDHGVAPRDLIKVRGLKRIEALIGAQDARQAIHKVAAACRQLGKS